jgi:hypothetical protein
MTRSAPIQPGVLDDRLSMVVSLKAVAQSLAHSSRYCMHVRSQNKKLLKQFAQAKLMEEECN